MAFRETIASKPFDLAIAAFGKFRFIAAPDHPADQLCVEPVHAADMPEGCHGTAKLVGFGLCKFSRDDCQLHGLFLEQGHTQRLAEYVAKFAGRMRRSRRRK